MTPTCHKVVPLLEQLQSEWETLHDDDKYIPVEHALDLGLKNMAKWYWKMVLIMWGKQLCMLDHSETDCISDSDSPYVIPFSIN